MYLVGMEHVALPGKAISASAAIMESLNSGESKPDRVGIVAMGRKSAIADVDLGTLDSRSSLAHADALYPARDPASQMVIRL